MSISRFSTRQLTFVKRATPLVKADRRWHYRGEGRAENLGCWRILSFAEDAEGMGESNKWRMVKRVLQQKGVS